MSWEMLGPAALHPDPNKIHGGIPVITPDDVRLALGGLGERPFMFGMAAFLGHRGSMERALQLLEWDLFDLAQRERWGTGRDRNGKHTGELTIDDQETILRMAGLLMFETISARSRHDTYAHEKALPAGSATVLCPECNGRGDMPRPAGCEELIPLHMAWMEACDLVAEAIRKAKPRERIQVLQERRKEARLALSAARAFPVSEECELCHGRGRFLLTQHRRAVMIGVSRPTWYRRWEAHYAQALEIPQRWEAQAIGHVRRKLRLDA